MSTLAHIFEAAGLATIVLASMREVAEKMKPPRSLYAEFPLGRPLGRPNDAALQHEVLAAAFALLDAPDGPVLADFGVVIAADETPISCALPPAFDPSLHPVVSECRGIRKAYDRSVERRGATSVGKAVDADGLERVIGALIELADGTDFKKVDLPGKNTVAMCSDLWAYYEEAALELVGVGDGGDTPDGRAIEAWFFTETEAGKLVLEAKHALEAGGAPFGVWFYMTPGHR